MNLKAVARRTLYQAMRAVTAQTLFSKHSRIRSLAFDAVSEHQRFFISAPRQGETFVVHAGDDWVGRELYLHGEFDFDKFTAAFDLVLKHSVQRRPTLLINVGANIGSICIPAVTRGYVERAVAVEPDPTNARLLRANIALNGVEDRIKVAEMAAGASDDQMLELELSPSNSGDHRIRVSADEGDLGELNWAAVKVRSSTLDTICSEEAKECVLISMDTQGYEGFVLSGSRSFISRRVPMILEFWPYGMERSGSFPELLSSLAEYAGFIDLRDPHVLRPIGELQELRRELGERAAFTDILVL